MRLMTAILALAISLPVAASNSVNIIAATATSSSPHAASVSCLLKPDCAGSWTPGSADSGANEGVYVQFESAVEADTVELQTNVRDVKPPFTLSINGALATRSSWGKLSADRSSGKYPARYAVAGSTVKSIFFRLGIRKGGWREFSLFAICFYKQGKVIDLQLPVLVPASVSATSVLEPAVAYQPANLFDSRYDFAWSTNGKNKSGKGE
jgi:hypothetical protein